MKNNAESKGKNFELMGDDLLKIETVVQKEVTKVERSVAKKVIKDIRQMEEQQLNPENVVVRNLILD